MRSRHTVSFNSERDIADASVDGGFFNGLLFGPIRPAHRSGGYGLSNTGSRPIVI